MNLNDQLKETGEDIKEELAKVKNWPVVKWLGKWIGLILVAVIVILFLIIGASAGLKYSTGPCPELLKDSKNTATILARCEKNDRGAFIIDFIDKYPERVPKEFNIYKAIEYRDMGSK